MQRRPWAVAVVVAVSLGLALGLVARVRHHARTGKWSGGTWLTEAWSDDEEADADVESRHDIPDAATVAWCADGLEPIPGAGCFLAPATPQRFAAPFPLLIYLHGIFDPAGASDELSRQSRLAERATARGFAVLALRGHVGQCTAPEYAARVCWPSNERNEDAGPAYVEEWRTPLAIARQRGASGRRYVLGFSNGGYFAGLLAERGWFDAEAFAVARAGPVEPVRASGRRVPMLLTLSDGDLSHDEMVKLDEELDRDEWPHERFLTHGGHALPDGDIDAALEFFARHEQAARAR